MRSLSNLLYRLSSWRTILLAVLIYALFLSRVMVPHAAEMQGFAGDWGAPDGHFLYTPDELYGQVATWGDAGRRHYVKFRLGLDPLWALTYTAFLITITSVALRRAFAKDDARRRLNVFPLLPMCADLLENGLGIAIMLAWPERLNWLAWLTTTTSSVKWLTLSVAHVVMLYALAAALSTLLRDRRA
jgi:hypothetical protein